ncbi:MAG TPA: hypothetical protein V6D10_03585 [Trichocoleus sp.]|jgi:hypothetical protein
MGYLELQQTGLLRNRGLGKPQFPNAQMAKGDTEGLSKKTIASSLQTQNAVEIRLDAKKVTK